MDYAHYLLGSLTMTVLCVSYRTKTPIGWRRRLCAIGAAFGVVGFVFTLVAWFAGW